jgi:CheY-like chemotaxis protein
MKFWGNRVIKINRYRTHQLLHSALEVLSSTDNFKPNIMLIDIGLPGIDGYELVQRLGELPSGQGVRKIALTGYGQYEDKQRAFDAGFDEHLVKPVEIEKLESVINGSESVVS